jgi:hypothetical protein
MRYKSVAVATMISVISAAGAISFLVPRDAHRGAHPDVARRPPAATMAKIERAPAVTAPQYRFTTVTLAGASDAQISAINNAGAYTGNVVTSSGNVSFLVAHPGASPVFLRLPFDAVAATVQTAGIDAAGGVVGDYADSRGVFHGFVRTARGTYKKLNIVGAGTAKGEGTEIAGMSAGGVIVGSYIGPSKVAVGFIDRNGRIARYAEKSAGHRPGDGTAVEFYSSVLGRGGIYIGANRAAHGWYVKNGKLHVVNDPAAGRPAAHVGTQLVGVDGTGRLYGLVAPAVGLTRAFSMTGGVFVTIRDPLQSGGATGQTLILGVNAAGVIVGSYTYDAAGRTRAFIARLQG